MVTDAQCRSVLARLRADRAGGSFLRCARVVAFVVAVCAAAAFMGGCGSKSAVHPALQLQSQDIDRATQRGKSLIASGATPYDAFAYQVVDVNQRVSSEVILRSAGLCWPADRVAYEIAKSGDASDAGVRRAVAAAMKAVERELLCVAEVQIPKTMDPAAITFSLSASPGVKYPPIAVETPVLLREFNPAYDPTAAPAGIYYYVIHFPVSGGPGVPPIGPQVTSLVLSVSDGTSEATCSFPMPRVEQTQ